MDCVDCLHHVLGGDGALAMAMVVIGNAEIVEDGEYVQPLEVGQVIQAECKPPLAVSSLLELGV